MPDAPPTFKPAGARPRGAWSRRDGASSVQRIRGRKGVALREAVRTAEPLCRVCLAAGRVSATTQVDHIVPLSRGGTDDRENFQGLCDACHEAKSATERSGQLLPPWLPKPAIPVTVVCGPPCAGKSTVVAESAGPDDVVIDLDAIIFEQTGQHGHDAGPEALAPALWLRNRRIADLQNATVGRAWLIVSAPTSEERAWWRAKLNATVRLINPGQAVCARRAMARARPEHHTNAVRAWFRKAT